LPPPRITGSTQITHDGQQKTFGGQVTTTVLTDGPRVFIQENVGGRFVIVQAASSGGDTVAIPTNFANVALDNISPDKSELLVGSFSGVEQEQTLWGLPVLGGTPRRLSDGAGVDGIWMPNGDLLISHDKQLWVVAKGGGAARKFADAGSFSWWLRWSPDGKVLRFTRNEEAGSGNQQWEVSAEGKNMRSVLPGWQKHSSKVRGNWTPDGKYFVFTVFAGERGDLWTVREKGDWLHKVDPRPVQLTAGPLSFEASQPSLDGDKIFAVGAQLRTELTRYDQKVGQFIPYLSGVSAVGVSFSPDREWVAYSNYPDGELWRSRIDGSEKLQLTASQGDSFFARWSPDGQQIAFISSRPGEPDQLCLVGKDGGTPRVLYQSQNVARPSWRKDGGAILFQESLSGPEAAEAKLLDLKSGQTSTIPGSKGLVIPVLSPDGHYVAADSADGKKLKLYDLETKTWQEFTPQSGVGFIEWSADSDYLYFDNGLSANPAIYRLRVAGKRVELVASLKDFRRLQWGHLPWLGVTPDGEPLVNREMGSQEVYALDFEAP